MYGSAAVRAVAPFDGVEMLARGALPRVPSGGVHVAEGALDRRALRVAANSRTDYTTELVDRFSQSRGASGDDTRRVDRRHEPDTTA